MTPAGQFRVGVYGLCVDGSGAVLLVQIYERDPYAGQWMLPGGGMDWGETPVETLGREFQEETGMVMRTADLIHAGSYVFEAWRDVPATHHVQIVYRVSAAGNPVAESEGSTVAVRWVAASDWQHLPLVPWVRALLERHTAAGGAPGPFPAR